MSKHLLKILLLLYLVSVLAGCASRRFPKTPAIPETSRRDIARQRAENSFIKARDHERRGLYQMAERFYEMACELDPESEVLRDLLVNHYLMSRKYKRALVLIKGQNKLEELSEKDKRTISGLYMEMKQFDKAVETLESISDATLSERATLGYLYERLMNNSKAIENYAKCFEKNPESFEMGMKLADLYLKEQMLDKAESLYVYLESKFDRKTEILNKLGTVSLLKKDTTAAINFYKTAMLLDSASTETITNLAHIYISRGDYTQAIDYYKKTVDGDFYGKFYLGKTLAILYYYNKQYEEAEETLKSLLAVNVDDYELHFYLALTFAAGDEHELAEIELRKSLALKDNYADAWLHLCYLFFKQKKWDKALHNALEFKEKMPEISTSWRVYGYALNIKKRFKEAIAALNKSLSYNPNDSEVWFELGSAYERSGNFRKADNAFRKTLRLNPNDDAAANYLGYMWAEQGKYLDSAKVLLEMALNNDPENGAYLDSYGWIFYKMGDLEKAGEYIIKAIKQIDDDPIIYSHLGDILAKKGDTRNAIGAYKKSIEMGSEEKDILTNKINKLQKSLEKTIDTPVVNENK